MLVTLAAWLANGNRVWTPNRINKAFLAFVLVMLGSWLATPYGDVGTKIVEDYLKVAVFFVLVLSTVRDEPSLRQLVMMFLAQRRCTCCTRPGSFITAATNGGWESWPHGRGR